MPIVKIRTCFAKGRTDYEEREIPQPFVTGIIDPDWPYTVAPGVKDFTPKEGEIPLSGFTRSRDTTQNQYEAATPLSITELGKLPIGDLIGGYIFMWTVAPFLIGSGVKKLPGLYPSAALYLLKEWGFEPCSMITWGKYNLERYKKEGEGGYGGVGFWFLGNAEFVIVGKKPGMPSIRTGKSSFIIESLESIEPSLIIEPKQKHSSKPKNIHELVESRFPGPYVEIFGREQRVGWTVLGDDKNLEDPSDIRVSLNKILKKQEETMELKTCPTCGGTYKRDFNYNHKEGRCKKVDSAISDVSNNLEKVVPAAPESKLDIKIKAVQQELAKLLSLKEAYESATK